MFNSLKCVINMFDSLFPAVVNSKFSTGIDNLDYALHNGLPFGKIVELSGLPDSGKTALALHLMQQVQQQNGIVLFINIDNNISLQALKGNNIDVSNLYICNSNNIEFLKSYIHLLCFKKLVDFIVIDSIPSLITTNEQNASMSSYEDNLNGSEIELFLKDIAKYIYGTDTCILCINQYRYHKDINDDFKLSPAWEYLFEKYAAVRLSVEKANPILIRDRTIGMCSLVKTLKNKLNQTKRNFLFPIYFYK